MALSMRFVCLTCLVTGNSRDAQLLRWSRDTNPGESGTMIMTSANIILVTLELFGQRQTGQKLIPVALDSFGDLSAVSTNRPPNAAVTRTTTYRFTRSMQAIVLFRARPFPAFNPVTAHQAHVPLRSRRCVQSVPGLSKASEEVTRMHLQTPPPYDSETADTAEQVSKM
jgi:hypothetical protein